MFTNKRKRESTNKINKKIKLSPSEATQSLLDSINHSINHFLAFDIALITNCLDSGANLNVYDQYDQPIFHRIGIAGPWINNTLEIALLFINRGVDVRAIDKDGNTFFHLQNICCLTILELLPFIKKEDKAKALLVKNKNSHLPWEIYLDDLLKDRVLSGANIEILNALMPQVHDFNIENFLKSYTQISLKLNYEEEQCPGHLKLLIYAIRHNLQRITDYYKKAIDLDTAFEGKSLLNFAEQINDKKLAQAIIKLGVTNIKTKIYGNQNYRDLTMFCFNKDALQEESIMGLQNIQQQGLVTT